MFILRLTITLLTSLHYCFTTYFFNDRRCAKFILQLFSFHLSVNPLFKELFFLAFKICFYCSLNYVYVCVCVVVQVPEENTGIRYPWHWSYTWLCTDWGMLGIKLCSSVTADSTLTHWAMSEFCKKLIL